jgi:hypothetical protein
MSGYYCNYRLLRNRCESYAGRIVELLPVNSKTILKDLNFIYEDPESTINLKDYNEEMFLKLCDTCIQYEREIYAEESLPFFGAQCCELFNQNKYGIYLLLQGVTLELQSYLDLVHRRQLYVTK